MSKVHTYKGTDYLPKNVNGELVELTDAECQEIIDFENGERKAYIERIEQSKTDAKNGNKKLLDLGLTQAEATALTGYTPPEEE